MPQIVTAFIRLIAFLQSLLRTIIEAVVLDYINKKADLRLNRHFENYLSGLNSRRRFGSGLCWGYRRPEILMKFLGWVPPGRNVTGRD